MNISYLQDYITLCDIKQVEPTFEGLKEYKRSVQ